MEFKVIFIGFALHCVLNLVLISKTVLTKIGVDGMVSEAIQRVESPEALQAAESAEKAMLQEFSKDDARVSRLSSDS